MGLPGAIWCSGRWATGCHLVFRQMGLPGIGLKPGSISCCDPMQTLFIILPLTLPGIRLMPRVLGPAVDSVPRGREDQGG